MFKKILLFILISFCMQSYSQKLIYNSNGNILNSDKQKISPHQVRELLASNEKMLADYNDGRSKKTIGNLVLIGGIGLLTADLLVGLTAAVVYPSALTYIGFAAVIIAIPIKIGFSNKIERVVNDYNSDLKVGYDEFRIQKTEFIANQNGAGIRLTIN